VRVLITSIASRGHLHPLLPLTRALFDEGHEVDVATGRVEPRESGLAALAAAARELLDDLVSRRPVADVLIHEEGEWGGPIYAALTGVPSVAVGWGAPLPDAHGLRAIDAATRPLWKDHGMLPVTPAGLFVHRYLDTCPPTLQRDGLPAAVEPMRWEPIHRSPAISESPGGVYVTLGTVPAFNRAPSLLATVIRALPDERLLITTGPGHRPVLPPHPNLRVAEYIPQQAAFGDCALAITHGGAGSTIGAITAGLPVLVLPRGAPSQHRTAAACAAAGVGMHLDAPNEQTVRAAARTLLDDPAFRERARAVAEELAALPRPQDIARSLEAAGR
jgi:UDP:flavonoid glycosyltransferase YjiC (YdhE family)